MNLWDKAVAVGKSMAFAIMMALWLVVSICGPSVAQSSTDLVLHDFLDGSVTNDGSGPNAALILGNDGNFYGTTYGGGSAGDGTVFKITPTGTVTILHSFGDGSVVNDGVNPCSRLCLGNDGNFYGTTLNGGSANYGTIYKITSAGVETILHAFRDGSVANDGWSTTAELVQATDGYFYGTTEQGGLPITSAPCGTVFKISSTGAYTILHVFLENSNDTSVGLIPYTGLVQAADGNFYGTTEVGGIGYGNLYKMTPSGTVTNVHEFFDGSVPFDGEYPYSSLIIGSDGNFYGTTEQGGTDSWGTVYQVTPAGVCTILHSFQDGASDGQFPNAALMQASDGNFYGTTHDGGLHDQGTVFQITPTGATTILHSFLAGTPTDGVGPKASLTEGPGDGIFGTTPEGGVSTSDGTGGTVFRIANLPSTTTLVSSLNSSATNQTVVFTATVSCVLPTGTMQFSVDNVNVGSAVSLTPMTVNGVVTSYKATYTAQTMTVGQHSVKAVFSGDATNAPSSSTLTQQVVAVTAAFVKTDTSTEGNWKGVYGADGWNVMGDTSANATSYPAYATVTPGSHDSGVWAATSLSPAALQVAAAGSANRVAGVWYQTSWSTTVDVTGTHQIALYLLDIDNLGIAETITVKDTTTGVVLDTRQASSFANGEYLVWNVDGNVTITLTSTAGHWAVLNGIFFGGTGSTAPAQTSGVMATAGIGQIGLTWTASTGATSYNVYRGTTAGGESTTPIATGITSPSYTNTGLTSGATYYYKVVAVNAVGGSFASSEVSSTPIAPTVSFVQEDTSTQGNWKGVYGADGWNVIGDTSANATSYPGYATVTPGSHDSGVWAATSLSPAALQVAAAGSANRVAGVWYQTSWSTTVDVTGTHQVALYLVDIDNLGIAETITVKDTTTGVVLDTRQASSFANGEYLVWNVDGNVTITLTSTAGHWAVLNGIFFGGTGPTAPPAPTGLGAKPGSQQIALTWASSTGATSYNVYRGTTAGGESTTPIATGITSPTYTNTGLTSGATYYYKVVAVNAVGGSFASAEASATVPTSTASFVKTDTSTQGNWKGVYGADGWNVMGDTSLNNPTYPSYASVAPGSHLAGVWEATSTSPAALQVAAVGSTARIAGVWYQTSWSTKVNVTGTHQLALYLLDINNGGFAETITITDSNTGAVLNTQSASSFANGVYYVWDVSGNVTVTFTSTSGHWAVLSGIFFGA